MSTLVSLRGKLFAPITLYFDDGLAASNKQALLCSSEISALNMEDRFISSSSAPFSDVLVCHSVAVGTLQYAAQHVRPDIATAVLEVANYMAASSPRDWIWVKLIFRNLSGTVPSNMPGFSTVQPNSTNVRAHAAVMAGAALFWKSRKQVMIGSATALSLKVTPLLRLQRPARGGRYSTWRPNVASIRSINRSHEDNQTCIIFSNNPDFRGRTRHWNIHRFYLRERFEASWRQQSPPLSDRSQYGQHIDKALLSIGMDSERYR
ncbi:BZ3500_MvSof-1268-A1-R1_Chr2-1g04154 [Microbotryum saponariae]|uniref:BZ3500_MvSof-1268-A1-R1_Chr2-1g04154 protein n=1 Tax=Microbotryum saponariae TaxID=289078 RepID=A0A2X0K7D4_9BASI|nr:BZ3500_MvSof-1268-A1-R1_Chr2-1g04154 [Microbotryum saponariae]SCZ91141.1 BZ3501_MvSof-1269-A2-R1_Chr2-1g03810 [Microbotryum saponariae]